jgi:hypothetical protein
VVTLVCLIQSPAFREKILGGRRRPTESQKTLPEDERVMEVTA